MNLLMFVLGILFAIPFFAIGFNVGVRSVANFDKRYFLFKGVLK
jgi:hypothetical protein